MISLADIRAEAEPDVTRLIQYQKGLDYVMRRSLGRKIQCREKVFLPLMAWRCVAHQDTEQMKLNNFLSLALLVATSKLRCGESCWAAIQRPSCPSESFFVNC